MRILVCGAREWSSFNTVYAVLKTYPAGTEVVHGACRGADQIGGLAAKVLGFKVYEFPANWEKHGKAAGLIRNQKMLDQGKVDEVLAFHNDIERSRGTADMVRRAKLAGKPCRIVKETE